MQDGGKNASDIFVLGEIVTHILVLNLAIADARGRLVLFCCNNGQKEGQEHLLESCVLDMLVSG